MKTLDFEQMECIGGGQNAECVNSTIWASLGTGLWAIAFGAALATTGPLGWATLAGIYGGAFVSAGSISSAIASCYYG